METTDAFVKKDLLEETVKLIVRRFVNSCVYDMLRGVDFLFLILLIKMYLPNWLGLANVYNLLIFQREKRIDRYLLSISRSPHKM